MSPNKTSTAKQSVVGDCNGFDGGTEGGFRGSSTGGIAFLPPPEPAEIERRRKDLIKQSWALVERCGPGTDLTSMFYARLVALYPDIGELFRNTDMTLQSRKMHEMVRVAVLYLDQIDEMLPTLRDMGVRHARYYGVQRSYYTAVTEVFIDVLNEVLEDALLENEETQQQQSKSITSDSMTVLRLDIACAWSWLLTSIGDSMANAADDAICSASSSAEAAASALSTNG